MGWLNKIAKVGGGIGGFFAGGPQGALAGWKAGDALTSGSGDSGDPYNFSGDSDTNYKSGGGGGMGWEDWATLGIGAAGALSQGYGTYKQGQAQDRDYTAGRDDEMFYRGRDEDRYQTMRGDTERAYTDSRGDLAYDRGIDEARYGDVRADIQYGRDFRDQSAAALRPEVDWLKNRRYG